MIEKIAQVATTLMVAVAMFSLWNAINEQNLRAEKNEIQKWQRIVIYNIISKNSGYDFEQIKSKYLDAAMQFDELPKEQLKNQVLQLALVELQKDNLITIDTDRSYRIATAKSQFSEELLWQILNKEIKERGLYPKLRLKVFDILKRNCQRQDELYREIVNAGEIEFSIFHYLLHSMRDSEIVLTKSGTWCLTHDVSSE